MRIRRTSLVLALLGTILTTTLAVTPTSPVNAAPGALVWSDEFNAPAGTPVDAEQVAVRHRRRRLGQQRAAVLHQQHQQRRPRRPGQPGHHRAPGEPGQLPVPLRHAASTPRPGCSPPTSSPRRTAGSRPASRSRAVRASGRRSGCSARHRQRRLAEHRRDRHHGEHRPGAEHRPRHHARPRLLRRRRHHGAGTPSARRWPTPSTPTRWTGSPNSIIWYVDGIAVPPRRPRPSSAATAGSSTTRSS